MNSPKNIGMGFEKPKETLNEYGLTEREAAFCHEYVGNGCNAGRAAIGTLSNGTIKTAASVGCRALKKPEILAYIRHLSEELQKRALMDKGEVLNRLANISRINPKAFFNDRGQLKHLQDLPDEVAECIQSFEIVTKEVTGKGKVVDVLYIHKIKFWDKLKGLELTGRTQALFIDRIEETVKHEFADLDDESLIRIIEGLAAKSSVSDLLARIGSQSKSEKDSDAVSADRATAT